MRIHRTAPLVEEVHVNGAQFLGSAKGFDLFNITTFAAAQEFVANGNQAGGQFVHDEATFNHNISDTQKLYFFVAENTNEVKCAVIKSDNSSSNVKFFNTDGDAFVKVDINMLVETEDTTNSVVNLPVPLYLIPDARAEGLTEECLVIKDNILKAVIGNFVERDSFDSFTLNSSYGVNKIDAKAFTYGVRLNHLYITTPLEEYPDHLTNVDEITLQLENVDIEQQETTVEEPVQEEPVQEEPVEEDERAENQTAPQQTQPAIRRDLPFIYRIVENEIYIVRGKKGNPTIVIPDDIDGIPVTTIEDFAFEGLKDMTEIRLPKTIKRIGRGAFLNTGMYHYRIDSLISRFQNNPKVFVGKNAFKYSN